MLIEDPATKIWIRGFSAAGKGVQTAILAKAFGTKVIGMSKELAGGDPGGLLCGEPWVRTAISSALEREGYFENDGTTVAVEGFFRSIDQTKWLPTMLASRGVIDARTAFVCLVTSTNEALFRMQRRYHQNLLEYHDPTHPRTELRKEEYGTKEQVYERFRIRLMPWFRDREKIRQILARVAKETGARMIDVMSGHDAQVENVAVDLARQLGWDESKSITVASELAAELTAAPPEKSWKDIEPVLVMPEEVRATTNVVSENDHPITVPDGVGEHRPTRVRKTAASLKELHRGTQDPKG